VTGKTHCFEPVVRPVCILLLLYDNCSFNSTTNFEHANWYWSGGDKAYFQSLKASSNHCQRKTQQLKDFNLKASLRSPSDKIRMDISIVEPPVGPFDSWD